MATLSLIVAMAENGVIGIDNSLPWRIPEDLQWFRRHTVGKPVVMGRKTYDSIGRPLPERRIIVLSRNEAFHPAGVEVVPHLEAALDLAAAAPEVMVAGGESIYRQLLPRAERLYLTVVHASPAGDAHFPPIAAEQWREQFNEPHPGSGDRPAYTFRILQRLPADP